MHIAVHRVCVCACVLRAPFCGGCNGAALVGGSLTRRTVYYVLVLALQRFRCECRDIKGKVMQPPHGREDGSLKGTLLVGASRKEKEAERKRKREKA